MPSNHSSFSVSVLFGFLGIRAVTPEIIETVADAALGQNVFGVGRIFFDTLAQV